MKLIKGHQDFWILNNNFVWARISKYECYKSILKDISRLQILCKESRILFSKEEAYDGWSSNHYWISARNVILKVVHNTY